MEKPCNTQNEKNSPSKKEITQNITKDKQIQQKQNNDHQKDLQDDEYVSDIDISIILSQTKQSPISQADTNQGKQGEMSQNKQLKNNNQSSNEKIKPFDQSSTETQNKNPETKIQNEEFNLDEIIQLMLSVQQKSPGTFVDLKLKQIEWLIKQSLKIIQQQEMLLRISAPLVVGTDIHGQYYDLLRFLNNAGTPPETSFLFLGDYVDRGKQSIESLCLLLAFKIKYPEQVFLLRGNHECQNITKIYGFWDECCRRFNPKLWKSFINLFNYLPVAALIDDKILCMHGGLSPDLKNLKQIERLNRPSEIPESGILCDLLWSDPAPSMSQYILNLIPKKWGENERGISYVFSEKVVNEFLEKHKLELIVRGHQVMEEGYEFFAKQKLVTIFSAPNYCNEFDNDGAMLKISSDLCCSFYKLKPAEKKSFK